MAKKTASKASKKKTKRVTSRSAPRAQSASSKRAPATAAKGATKKKTTPKKAVKKTPTRKKAVSASNGTASAATQKKSTAAKRVPAAAKRTVKRVAAVAGTPKRPPGGASADFNTRLATTAAHVGRSTTKPLTKAEIEDFRRMLIQKRNEILGDVSTLQGEALNANRQEAAGDLSSMPIHMADLGSDNYELEFTLGLIEGERAILKEIDEALERIKNKTYGFCLATANPIGKARLKAKPWAKYCYEYTLAQETGQVQGL